MLNIHFFLQSVWRLTVGCVFVQYSPKAGLHVLLLACSLYFLWGTTVNSAGYSKFQKKSNVTSILRICGRNNDCNFEDQVHVVETIKGWLERESGKFLLVKSRILVFGIRNLQRGILNPRLSWIPLHLGQADWSQVNISGLPGYPNPVKQCRIFMYYPWVIGDMLTWSLCSELFQSLTRMVINSKFYVI